MKRETKNMKSRLVALFGTFALVGMLGSESVQAAGGEGAPLAPPAQTWSFTGAFGSYDRAALQRGYQVYREVCAVCHSMDYVAFRNLSQKGGPEFSEAAVKALAAEFTVEDGPDEFGDMFERPGKPSDYFPAPYPNDNAAAASNGGAMPPDLSLITKARMNGPDYVYALLTGYEDAPADVEVPPGLNYNPYFKNHQIAMASPLFEGIVEYSDGTEASVTQMSSDVVNFLTWAAEPELEQRKGMATPVLIYLLILTLLLYASYKRIWKNVSKD